MQVNMHEAKSQLSRLGRLAWDGEDVVIAKAGEPYLRLTPYRKETTARRPGALKGQIWTSPDFDDTPGEIASLFENTDLFPKTDDA